MGGRMVCLGHEATGVGCTLVEVGMGIVVDGSDVEVDRVLRAKDPKVRRAQVCMTVAGLVLQGITGG